MYLKVSSINFYILRGQSVYGQILMILFFGRERHMLQIDDNKNQRH